MKLKALFGNWTKAIETFWVAHVLLLVLTIIGIGEIEGFIDLDSANLVIALVLAFIISCYGPLFLIHSNLKKKNTINSLLQIGSLIIGGLYYYILYNTDLDDLTYSEGLLYIRVLPLALLGIPLIIAILQKKSESKIRFSWTNLFIAIIFGGIAGSIIRGGISGALASIEALFDVDIDGDLYADIGFISEVLLAGSFVFNFYITFTENLNQKSNFEIKPSRLRKIFGSFIFLPLALIYLAIFAAYGIKILITGIWPKGIIVRLGTGYFALGIISSYLIYPDKTKIHEIINKIFYVSFILMSFMMIGAIVKRIEQYGITINRCFVCYIIAFIIIFSALSLIFTKKRLLTFVSTLGILAFIAVYTGPLNVGNISFNSQLNRLETLLSKENISLPLTEGALKDVNEESTKLIMGTLDGLVENYNKNKIINKVINYEYKNSYRAARSEIRVFLRVNLDYVNDPAYKYRDFRQYGEYQQSIDVTGYSKILYFRKSYGDFNDFTLNIQVDDQEYKVDLSNHIEELKEKSDIYEKSELTKEEEEILRNPALILTEPDYKVIINSFGMQENPKGESQIYNAEGYILIK